MMSASETPRCDALELDKLDSFDLLAWKTLARKLERESELLIAALRNATRGDQFKMVAEIEARKLLRELGK
jgi:hypothetical protein